MKNKKSMSDIKPYRWRRWLCVFLLMVSPVAGLGHGGEDHGAEQASVVAASTGMVARTAKVGEWEVVIKHPSLEPDKELAARVFVTKHDTNEPIEGANITVTISGVDAAPTQVLAVAGNTPGVYEVMLPPMPKGAYKLAVQVGADSGNETAQFGEVQVASPPVVEASSVNGWARTGLIILAALLGLGATGVTVMRLMQSARSRKGETAAA